MDNSSEITTERQIRWGKEFIVIYQACYYPADKWTEETAVEDYIKTHRNSGFDFIPRFGCGGKQ